MGQLHSSEAKLNRRFFSTAKRNSKSSQYYRYISHLFPRKLAQETSPAHEAHYGHVTHLEIITSVFTPFPPTPVQHWGIMECLILVQQIQFSPDLLQDEQMTNEALFQNTISLTVCPHLRGQIYHKQLHPFSTVLSSNWACCTGIYPLPFNKALELNGLEF